MQVMSIAAGSMIATQKRFSDSAARSAAQPLENLEEAVLEQIRARASMKAAAAVMATADEITGTLLNIVA